MFVVFTFPVPRLLCEEDLELVQLGLGLGVLGGGPLAEGLERLEGVHREGLHHLPVQVHLDEGLGELGGAAAPCGAGEEVVVGAHCGGRWEWG